MRTDSVQQRIIAAVSPSAHYVRFTEHDTYAPRRKPVVVVLFPAACDAQTPKDFIVDAEQRAAILDLPSGPEPISEDVTSPEAAVQAVYNSISGPAEEDAPRDWDRLRSLFLPNARLVLVRWGNAEKEVEILRAWDVEGFITAGRDFYRDSAFYEHEVSRRVDRFGNIAQVFSTYESRWGSQESEPVARGINGVQLVQAEGRWWIAHLIWDVERPTNRIPEAYLQPDAS